MKRLLTQTDDQARHDAALQFVSAFGMVNPYGGGVEVTLYVGGRRFKAIDGWKGRDEAVARVASQLARAAERNKHLTEETT